MESVHVGRSRSCVGEFLSVSIHNLGDVGGKVEGNLIHSERLESLLQGDLLVGNLHSLAAFFHGSHSGDQTVGEKLRKRMAVSFDELIPHTFFNEQVIRCHTSLSSVK